MKPTGEKDDISAMTALLQHNEQSCEIQYCILADFSQVPTSIL